MSASSLRDHGERRGVEHGLVERQTAHFGVAEADKFGAVEPVSMRSGVAHALGEHGERVSSQSVECVRYCLTLYYSI